jgi:4-hydroxy-4-methyl-2-oxoglutarate aldolase
MTDPARGHSTATLLEAAGTDISVARGIRSVWPGARLCGPAFTVQGAGGDNLALHRAVAEAPRGYVLVVDVGGAAFGHWGEILTVAAQHRGVTGLLIDGGIRDRIELERLGFPAFSRHDAIRGTRKDFAGVLGGPIHVGRALVHPGDLVVGDADGVVIIPAGDIDRVLHDADDRVAKEREIIEQLRAGRTTLELYPFGRLAST